MFKDFELNHGLILTKLVHATSKPIMISVYNANDNAGYIINNKIGIYIKYCEKRLTPWRFTFLKSHQDAIQGMQSQLAEVYILLICHKDGVVLLDWESLKMILDSVHKNVEWVSVSRGKNKMYSVCGTDCKSCIKIARNAFPLRIIEKL